MSTIVLLPGLGRGPEDFDLLAGYLRDAGYEVLPFDPRPRYESGTPRYGLTLHDIAADVAAVLPGPAHLVGHAFGNRVARCLAADRPDLVRTVTLLAAGGLIPPDPEVQRAFFSADPAERASVLFAAASDPSAFTGRSSAATAAAQQSATQATPLDDWWTGGTAPMLIIQGLEDRLAVPENGRQLAAELGGRARLVELQDAGHALVLEQPEAIAAALLDFLAAESA